MTLDAATSNLPQWETVYMYSVTLAVFGAVLTSLLPVFSTVGSALLVIVIIKFPQLRHIPSNILLASLALSDFLIGLFIQPWFAASRWCAMTSSSICTNLMDINAAKAQWYLLLLCVDALFVCELSLEGANGVNS